jgi:hypothetical protein
MTTISPHTTRANGTILTATIYNADHVNHISNAMALNDDKIEGVTPPVVDGALAVFDGTAGNALRESSINESDLDDFGDVVGPAGGVVEAEFVQYDGTTGKLIQGSSLLEASTADVRAATDNRVMTAEQIEDASAIVTLTDAATIAVDMDTFINGVVTLAGNRTLGNPTNEQIGVWRTIEIVQDATGSRTLAYSSEYVFPAGTEPVLTTTANARDRIAILPVSSTRHEVYLMGLDLKQ